MPTQTSESAEHDTADAASSAPLGGPATWLLYAVATPFAAFEAVTAYSTLAGAPALGAVGGLTLCAAIMLGIVFALVPGADRRGTLARVCVFISVLAVVSLVALGGKIAAAQGVPVDGPVTVRAALLLVFQLGWAVTYRLRVDRIGKSDLSFVPAALGGVLLVAGGLMSNGAGTPAPVDEGAGERFVTFPRVELPPFARETERAGDRDRGSAFAHYHTGRRPLLGLALSTRDWMRRERVGSDLRGIFDREAPVAAQHVLLARPGYVVAAIETRVGDHINALRVQFGRLEGARVSYDDTYWSEWVGERETSDERTDLDGYARPVIGIAGSAGMVLDSLSLLVAG